MRLDISDCIHCVSSPIQFQNGINVLDHNARGRYSMETVTAGSEGDTIKSILSIADVAKSDEDVYLCMMENPFGSDEKEVALIVQEPPRPPRDLRASQVTSTTATLLFLSPDAFAAASSSPSSAVVFKRRGFPRQSLLPVTNFIVEVAPLNGKPLCARLATDNSYFGSPYCCRLLRPL